MFTQLLSLFWGYFFRRTLYSSSNSSFRFISCYLFHSFLLFIGKNKFVFFLFLLSFFIEYQKEIWRRNASLNTVHGSLLACSPWYSLHIRGCWRTIFFFLKWKIFFFLFQTKNNHNNSFFFSFHTYTHTLTYIHYTAIIQLAIKKDIFLRIIVIFLISFTIHKKKEYFFTIS